MTTTPFTYRGAGDRLVLFASEYNAFIDAALAERGRTSGLVGSGYAAFPESSGVLPATYSTPDAAVPANGIVEIGSAVYSNAADAAGFRSRVVLRAIRPTVAHARNIGIAIRGSAAVPAESQDTNVQPVQVSGIGIARVVVTNEAHDYATARASDSDKLQSGWTGPVRILHKQPAEDRVSPTLAMCVVELGADYPGRWFRLTAAVASGDPPIRYNYTGRVARKTGAANTGWADRDAEDVTLYHTLEYLNNGSGVEGHGVNIDTLPAGFAIKPIPVGTPVFAEPVVVEGSPNTLEWWITAVSPIDGECGALDAQDQREFAAGRAATQNSSSATFAVVDRWSSPHYIDATTFTFGTSSGVLSLVPGTYRLTLDAAATLASGTDSVASLRFASSIDGGSYATFGPTNNIQAIATATIPAATRLTAFITVASGETAGVRVEFARASGTGTVQLQATGTLFQAERLS